MFHGTMVGLQDTQEHSEIQYNGTCMQYKVDTNMGTTALRSLRHNIAHKKNRPLVQHRLRFKCFKFKETPRTQHCMASFSKSDILHPSSSILLCFLFSSRNINIPPHSPFVQLQKGKPVASPDKRPYHKHAVKSVKNCW